jgi:hypothetical protein
MTGKTEARLRDATTALAQAIRPQDIPDLRLPEPGTRRDGAHQPWHATGRWTGGRWLIPVAAAATLLALVISLIMLGGLSRRPNRRPAEPVRGMPAYLIVARNGRGYVQATATGQMIARIPPPVRGFLIDGVAVQSGERAFYLAGEVPFGLPRVKIEFFRFTLDSSGRPGRPQQLGAPVIERRPNSWGGTIVIPLAISPDGSELAYAWPDPIIASYGISPPAGPATITVQNVATGNRRTWSVWPSWGTGISDLSFAAGNRLGFVAMIYQAAVSRGAVVRRPGNVLRVFMILNTAAPGSSLVADSRLIDYTSQAFPPGPGAVVATAGPFDAIMSPDGRSAYVQLLFPRGFGGGTIRVERMSVTGQVTNVLMPEELTLESNLTSIDGGYPMGIEGNQMLIFLPPRHPSAHRGTVCAIVVGVNLSTKGVSRLPEPRSCFHIPAAGPFEVAW